MSDTEKLTKIAENAQKMTDIEKMIEYVEAENLKLNRPIAEDDLNKLIHKTSMYIRENQTKFDYNICLAALKTIKPHIELEDRILQALEFIELNILSREGNITKMEMFIETQMLSYFAIPTGVNHPMAKIFRNGYREAVRSKKKKYANQQKIVENASKHSFDIDPQFDGLYQTSITGGGNLVIEPFYDKIAKYVSDKLHVISFNGNMFVYENGHYKIDPYTVKAEATCVLNSIMKNENSRDVSKRLTDLLTYIQNSNVVNEYPFNKHDNAFPVRNGVVVVDFENGTHRLENPDPNKWKFDYALDTDYKNEADSAYILTTFKKYLYDNPGQTIDVDEEKGRYDYRVIMQMTAQGILQAMGYGPYKSVYLIVGPPDNGKTTILDFIAYLAGDRCKCTIGLEEFTSGDRFVMARKEGKVFNLHDDLGYFKIGDTGRVKAMSGGYNHKIERKGRDGYDGRITTVDIYTANQTAGFNRHIYLDKAFWGRWYYVHFPNHFEQNDEFKKNTFTEENKSAFLNEVIKMIIEIRQAKRLVVKKEEWTEVRMKWMQAGNILYKFIEDNMVAGGKTSLIKDELFTALNAWCIDNKQGEDLLPQKSFDLGDMVELCGGVGDARKVFKNKDIYPHHCFVLNYTWKPISRYKKYCPSEGATDQDLISNYS